MTDVSRRSVLLAGAAAASLLAQTKLEDRLALPTGRVDAVLDTDTYNEIDDQFAVAYALRSADRIKLEAIYAAPYLNDRSTSAGDGMQKSYEEILRILGRMKVDSAKFAYTGSKQFMQRAGAPVESAAATDLIAKAMKQRDGLLYVLTIGAPTNVSSAILMEPKIKDRIVVVWLGGQPFDWRTAREFNLQQDIHSSRVLYDSGVPLVNIPTKNVSEHLRTTISEVDQFLRGKSPIADYLASEFTTYAKAHMPSATFAYSKVIWDISVIAWLIDPKWIPSKLAPSPVLTDDFRYEQRAGRHVVRVATECNRDRVFDDLFRKLVRS
jgi:inosine-uridine nucleoside N-ribohydrolase